MSYEQLLDRARMMLTFGMSKDDVLKKMIESGEDKSLAYFAIIGATILMKREEG